MTFLVLIVQVCYYILATPLQWSRLFRIHSTLFYFTTTAGLLVCLMFWAIFLYDKGLLIEKHEANRFPLWFSHAAHSIGICSNLIDALIWRPCAAPLFPSFMVIFTFAGGYTLYLEYLIRIKNIYPYPLLAQLSIQGRTILYVIGWILVALCLLVAYLYVRFINRPTQIVKRKAANKKEESSRQQHDGPAGRTRKSRKAD